MSLQDDFDTAVADSRNLPERPDNATMLTLYALYKQARSSDADGERPGMTDFVARAKWDAWSCAKGTGKDEAMRKYVKIVGDLKD